jgi:hypothetical protein
VGRLFVIVVLLAFASWPASALEAKVAAELERIANGPAAKAREIAVQLQSALFDAIEISCQEQQDVPSGQCEYSRLLSVLDHNDLLKEHCSSLGDGKAVSACIVVGPEALPIVESLGGDPRKDIDWSNVDDSYLRLREALKDAARKRCAASQRTNDPECIVVEQAALLGFPPAAGLGCAKQPGKYDKQGCLDALLTIAVYLSAVDRLLDESEPL